jgi:hypothetical protein
MELLVANFEQRPAANIVLVFSVRSTYRPDRRLGPINLQPQL